MTFDDDLRELEDELRSFQPTTPGPQLQKRVSGEIAKQSAIRALRWPWVAAAAGLLGGLSFIAAAFLGRPSETSPPEAQVTDTTAWTYTVAARRSSEELFKLLDTQAAGRRRAGPVTAAPIALALIRQTETQR